MAGQAARVAVGDEQWLAFRQAALARGESVSAYIGRLIERELARRAGRPVAAVDAASPTREQALAALAEVRASIDELDAIAGRLARSAAAHGAPWRDIGTALRLPPDDARHAYEGDH